MRRIATIFLVSIMLTGCTALIDGVQKSAEAKLQQFLANQFGQSLQSGINFAVSQLAAQGGFLDDPLVRILLPPPLGLVLGVARDIQQNPQEALLEVLINQAAENSIPVAGPILTNIVMKMDVASLEAMLESGDTAATDYLKEQGSEIVKEALVPVITEQLHLNGAIELYGKLLEAEEVADGATGKAAAVQQAVEKTQQTIETAQQQIEIAQQQIETTQQQVETVQKQLEITEQQAEHVPPQTETAQAQIETSEQIMDTAQQQLETAQQQVGTIQQQAETAKQQIETPQKIIEAPAAVTQEQLAQYVAEQAMAGLFKKVAKQEASIHEYQEMTY